MELHREIRFYTCLLMGFSLMVWGFMTPPPGEISDSALIASGILFSIGALSVGLDIKGCIAEIIRLRETEHKLLMDKATTNDK